MEPSPSIVHNSARFVAAILITFACLAFGLAGCASREAAGRPSQPTLLDAERVQLRVVDQGRRLGLRWRYLGAIGSEQTRGLEPVYRPGTWELLPAERSTTLLTKSDIVLCFGILPSDLAPVAHQIDERKGITVYLPQNVSLDSPIAEGCTVGQFVRAVCVPQ